MRKLQIIKYLVYKNEKKKKKLRTKTLVIKKGE